MDSTSFLNIIGGRVKLAFFKTVNEKQSKQFQKSRPSRQSQQRNFLIGAHRKKVRDSEIKVRDSEIAVSVSINDMRKELLKDVKKDPKYNVLNNFLEIVPDDTKGFKIFTRDQSKIDRFTNGINKFSYLQKIYLSSEMPREVIMSHIKKILEDKNTNVKDKVFRKFYRYVKKVVSLEYKNLKHIPKRRYYNPAADINKARQYLLQDIKENHQYDYMNVVLQIPVDRNKGIDLSSDLNTNTACLNTLSNVLNNLEIKKYLDAVISQQNDKNSSFNELLEFLKSQESHQNDPINKEFLGYIIRVVEIEYRGINQPLQQVKKTTQSDIQKTLFPNGSPKIEDIKQGNIGDCYLLAALMSIIRKDPEYIKRCFPRRNNYDINQKTVKVKLHKVKVNLTVNENHMIFTVSSVGDITIEVDNTILMKRKKLKPSGVYNNESHLMPFGNQTKALWVNFMEKAFSVYKNIEGAVTADNNEAEGFIKLWKQDSDHSLSGQNVNGGWEFMPFSIITGKESKSMPLEYVNHLDGRDIYKKDDEFIRPFNYSAEENKIFNYIHTRLCKNIALTAGTKDIIDKDASQKEIFLSHAYSIESTRIDQSIEKKYIVLKNPHMKKVIRDPNTGDDLKAGTIVLELSDFVKYFKDVNELDLKSVLDKN